MAQSTSHAGADIHHNPYTGGIARFVSGLQYEAVPDAVRTRIKLLILDSLGCALYGADLPWTRILQQTLSGLEGGGMGQGGSTSVDVSWKWSNTTATNKLRMGRAGEGVGGICV
jgi:hypothetical protein